MTLLDNPLFLEQQKFGPGDGQLHYYLYNYRTAPISGGVDAKNNADASKRGGIGVVMVRFRSRIPIPGGSLMIFYSCDLFSIQHLDMGKAFVWASLPETLHLLNKD